MKVYDWHGAEQDMDWLAATFGQVAVVGRSDIYEVDSLRAIEGPSTLVATVIESDGRPRSNVLITFGWPTLNDPDEVVKARTDGGGAAGLGMGVGGWYDPAEVKGPHWVCADNLCVEGLGMLPLSNHIHPDVTFRVKNAGPPAPEPPTLDELWQGLYDRLDRLIELLEAP